MSSYNQSDIYIAVCKWVGPHYTTDCLVNISTQKVCMVTQKLDLDQMSERSICTLKDTNMMKLTSVANFGFICFIWPCSDDSDDICDIKWDIKCYRNFWLPPWILPTEISRTRRTCISPIKYGLAFYQVLLCKVVFMKLSSGSSTLGLLVNFLPMGWTRM